MKKIVVVAAVLEEKGRILCVQRPPNKKEYISRKWEFPGGKIESGETQPDALIRELREELCVAIVVEKPVLTVRHEYPDFHLTMHAYRCRLSPGVNIFDLKLNEHIDLRWLATTDEAFQRLDWAAADIPIVDALAAQRAPFA